MTRKQVHVALGIVCCKKSDSICLLITRRPGDSVLGGYWEFPGGKVEAGETPRQAAIRELSEEIGIQVEPVKSLTVVEHLYDHAHVHLHPWLCRWVDGEVKNLQVMEHQWVTLDKLPTVRFPPANGAIVEQLLQIDYADF